MFPWEGPIRGQVTVSQSGWISFPGDQRKELLTETVLILWKQGCLGCAHSLSLEGEGLRSKQSGQELERNISREINYFWQQSYLYPDFKSKSREGDTHLESCFACSTFHFSLQRENFPRLQMWFLSESHQDPPLPVPSSHDERCLQNKTDQTGDVFSNTDPRGAIFLWLN